jgi:hypothetical protein
VSLGHTLYTAGAISQNDIRTGRHLSIRELGSLTQALCFTGALAVVAVSDRGWALEVAAVVLVAWAVAPVEVVVLVARPG